MRPENSIIPYSYPTLSRGKVWFVSFYYYDAKQNKTIRKRYKLSHIKNEKQRKRYAQQLIYKLMDKLDHGWLPGETKGSTVVERYRIDAVQAKYLAYVEHNLSEGLLRPDSAKSYKSYLNVFCTWCAMRDKPVEYCDSLCGQIISEFLDYIFVELSRGVTTRNNYLVWLGSFSQWMLEHGYISSKPTEGIKHLPKKKDKNRTTIDDATLLKIKNYCLSTNKHFLLVVMMVYYCFIRPKELSMLRLKDVNLQNGVITVAGNISKNKVTATVTLPRHLILYMVELGIFNHPSSSYIFSKDFMPGTTYQPSKRMSDFWHLHLAKALSLPSSYKLYSLKDTGITKLLHKIDALSVRDQARHSDISITNIYAEKSSQAIDCIRDFEDVL